MRLRHESDLSCAELVLILLAKDSGFSTLAGLSQESVCERTMEIVTDGWRERACCVELVLQIRP